MTDFSVYADSIESEIKGNGRPSERLIQVIKTAHITDRDKLYKLHARYNSDVAGTPIFQRTLPVSGKINNKIGNNFFKKIVNTKIGYYASKIAYQLDRTKYQGIDGNINKVSFERDNNLIMDMLTRSSTARLDSEIARMMSVCGYGVKILYIRDGEVWIETLSPYDCIFISQTDEPQYCLRYYQEAVINPPAYNTTWRTKFEFYDKGKIYIYQEDAGQYSFIEEKPHLFDFMPVIQFRNNSEALPDADDSVISLIDAYDLILSDGTNDLEQLAHAYLVISGMILGTDETERAAKLEEMKQSGVFEAMEGGSANFIIKNINDGFINNMLNRIETNIYSFASSINTNDEAFANNASGVAMKYKMLALETASQLSENEFKAASLYMFRVITSFWEKTRKGNIDYLDVYLEMKRNFPLDLIAEAQTSGMLKGLISERTRLSLLSFIDDVEFEIEQMKQDANPYDDAGVPPGNPLDQSGMPDDIRKAMEAAGNAKQAGQRGEAGGTQGENQGEPV